MERIINIDLPDCAGIYALTDPSTNQVRYIGLSLNMKKRVYCHLVDYNHKRKLHWPLYCWIRKLKKDNKMPSSVCLTSFNYNFKRQDLCNCEKYWISYFRSAGVKLLNCTDGGDESFAMNEDTKKKISLSRLGKKTGPESEEKKIKKSLDRSRDPFTDQYGNVYRSQGYASRVLNIPKSCVGRVLRGERSNTCGLVFTYLKDAHPKDTY